MNYLFILLILLSSCTKNGVDPNVVVIQVNSAEITAKKFGERLSEKLISYDALLLKDEKIIYDIKQKVADELIVEMIINNWADAQKISVTEEQITNELNSIYQEYPDKNSSVQARATTHLSAEESRLRAKNSLLISELVKYLKTEVPAPSSKEIEATYKEKKDSDFTRQEQIHLEQIVLHDRVGAEKILEQLNKSPGSFSELAKTYSIAPEADTKGDLGWISRGSIDIFDKAFAFPLNQIKGIIESPYGFHIMRVVEKRPKKVFSLTEAEPKIKSSIEDQKVHQKYLSWLESQIRLSTVKKNDGLIAKIKVETRGE